MLRQRYKQDGFSPTKTAASLHNLHNNIQST